MSTASASDRFWPATFAERGATVPFTTPVLAAARLRSTQPERVEYLIPGLSGSKGTYVIPAKSVPEMFRLTVHDRALLEEMERKGNDERRPDSGARRPSLPQTYSRGSRG